MAKVPKRVKDSVIDTEDPWAWRNHTCSWRMLFAILTWAHFLNGCCFGLRDGEEEERHTSKTSISLWRLADWKWHPYSINLFEKLKSLQCLQIFGQLQIWNSYSHSSVSVTYEPQLTSGNRTSSKRIWSTVTAKVSELSQTAGCGSSIYCTLVLQPEGGNYKPVDERKLPNESILKDSLP